MASHLDLGKKGENLACDYLKKNGFEIVARNYFFDKAEVDIIARKKNILSVVEVKTRSSAHFGNPQDFITKKKIQYLVKAANQYVIENDLDVEVRFDVIAIQWDKTSYVIEFLEDAFLYF